MDFLNISAIGIVAFLILPGFIARRFFYFGIFHREYSRKLFVDRLVTSIILGVASHISAFYLCLFVFNVRPEQLLRNGAPYIKTLLNLQPVGEIHSGLLLVFFTYMIVVSLMGAVLGYTCYFLVTRAPILRNSKTFRFSNEWAYYFADLPSTQRGRFLMLSLVDLEIQRDGGITEVVEGKLKHYITDPKNCDLRSIILDEATGFLLGKNRTKSLLFRNRNNYIVDCAGLKRLSVRHVYDPTIEKNVEFKKWALITVCCFAFIMAILPTVVQPHSESGVNILCALLLAGAFYLVFSTVFTYSVISIKKRNINSKGDRSLKFNKAAVVISPVILLVVIRLVWAVIGPPPFIPIALTILDSTKYSYEKALQYLREGSRTTSTKIQQNIVIKELAGVAKNEADSISILLSISVDTAASVTMNSIKVDLDSVIIKKKSYTDTLHHISKAPNGGDLGIRIMAH